MAGWLTAECLLEFIALAIQDPAQGGTRRDSQVCKRSGGVARRRGRAAETSTVSPEFQNPVRRDDGRCPY